MDDEYQKVEPVRKYRVGSVTAAVWLNNGSYSVTLQKSYKTDEDKWQNTTTLFHGDVVCAMRALDRAEHFIGRQP